ncbi:hypothetical protein Ddye_009660 [Dipteronia dyeriana]|uniref:UDP-rhamnose:rhamnosyltransferase 1 n=1 Tax=Dipteronia dyeriana TaxID=168575 RepID=A0AAE0CN32_9ROSI|nr:hypothetical protein Ddye_009660 [Dipteronia dyeriana]
MTTSSRQLHIAMFPWLAFGHIIPYLEVAKLIAQRGHKITLISTPRNIDRLPKLADPNLAASINFLKLTLPHQENLPKNAEATSDISPDKVQYLKKAFDGLQDPLSHFLQISSPDWIIYDFAPHWLPPIAAKLGISRVFFFIITSWATCSVGSSSSAMINGDDQRIKPEHFTVPPEWVPFPTNIAFRFHEAKKLLEHVEVNESGLSDFVRLGLAISGCDVFATRGCFELESDWLKLLGELHQKPVTPLGLLPPQVSLDDNTTDTTIIEWLGEQNRGSVIYVALGSELTLSKEQVTELALGLELSGLPFFWALRTTANELPDGFEERIKGRGLVWTSWAPQFRILSHDSVGGFLTHCGWSSVVEGLHFGRALVMLPFLIDQGLNARFLEDKMLGKEIPRDDQNGSFTRNSVAETLRFVILEDQGRIFRENAREIRKLFGDRELHDRYIDRFLDYLQNYKTG